MKKVLLYLSILMYAGACQRNMELPPASATTGENDKVLVSLNLSLPEDISFGTSVVPMSKALEDTIKADVNNRYRAIFIKKIGDNWFVDTIVNPILMKDKEKFSEYPIYDHTLIDPLQIELRPGIYKVGIFLNPGTLAWNGEVKPGAFVATDADIQSGTDILPAADVHIVGKNYEHPSLHQNGAYNMHREIFSGAADFEVRKNTNTGNTQTYSPVTIQLKRRVARFRYLFKVPENRKDADFGKTQYWLTAVLKTKNGSPFCEGLNILGQPYYANRDSLIIYCSAESNLFYSEKDKNYYQMPVNIPSSNFPTSGQFGEPTVFSPFILCDDTPVECSFRIITISGPGDGNMYLHKPEHTYTLVRNSIFGIALERDTTISGVTSDESNVTIYQTKLLEGVDVTQSFHSFYELNPE